MKLLGKWGDGFNGEIHNVGGIASSLCKRRLSQSGLTLGTHAVASAVCPSLRPACLTCNHASGTQAAPPSWKLSRIPPALTTELEAYLKHRTDPFVRARDGTAAQDITVGNDRATVLRFLGWAAAERQLTPGLGVFCRPDVGQLAEEWMRALRLKRHDEMPSLVAMDLLH